MRLLKTTLLPLLVTGLVGCADTDEAKNIPEPDFGKADSLRAVDRKGVLPLGEALTAEFSEDMSFHGYQFAALETGEVTIEVTQRGTSRGLDTTLWLYGETPSQGWERIAFDDDDGWGPLSRLTELRVGDHGQFMIVVGTVNGMGRGNYRVQLTCTNDACVDTSQPTFDPTTCDGDLYNLVEWCVEEDLSNADYDYDDPAEQWAIEWCTSEGVLDYRDTDCWGANTSNPAFCAASTDQLLQGAGHCTSLLHEAYNVVPTVGLGRLALSPELEAEAERLAEEGTDYSSSRLEGFTTPEDANTLIVGASIRQDYGRARDLSLSEVIDRAVYREWDYLPERTLDLIEAEHGTNYSVVRVTGSYYVAAGAEEWVTIHVIHYDELDIGYAITEISGE